MFVSPTIKPNFTPVYIYRMQIRWLTIARSTLIQFSSPLFHCISTQNSVVYIGFVFFSRIRDEDMQSMASLMSVNNNSDIAPLEDFEDEDFSLSENSMKNSIQEVTQHLQKMTNSLSGSDFASTPMSGKSGFFLEEKQKFSCFGCLQFLLKALFFFTFGSCLTIDFVALRLVFLHFLLKTLIFYVWWFL